MSRGYTNGEPRGPREIVLPGSLTNRGPTMQCDGECGAVKSTQGGCQVGKRWLCANCFKNWNQRGKRKK